MDKQERINQAIEQQRTAYEQENQRLREEEKANGITYDKSVFYYRKQSCSATYAVDYIKRYYKEIKISKKKLKELISQSDIVKFSGHGTIGYRSSQNISGVSRISYDLLDMDSVDLFAVSLIEEMIK